MLTNTSAISSIQYAEAAARSGVVFSGKTASASSATGPEKSSEVNTSNLLAISTHSGLSEVSIQGEHTSIAYRGDGSLALQARTSFDFTMHSRVSTLEVTLPAEAFGEGVFSSMDFKGGSIELSFEATLAAIDVQCNFFARQVNSSRKPEEVLNDMVSVLRKALTQSKSERVRLELDQEAVQVLMGDQRMRDAVQSITALLWWINTRAALEGKQEESVAKVSGRGKPYQEVNESTHIQAQSHQVKVHFTITPPMEKQAQATSAGLPSGEQEIL